MSSGMPSAMSDASDRSAEGLEYGLSLRSTDHTTVGSIFIVANEGYIATIRNHLILFMKRMMKRMRT